MGRTVVVSDCVIVSATQWLNCCNYAACQVHNLVDPLNSIDRRPDPLEPLEVFVFPGLGGDESELAAMRAGCGSTLRFVTIEFPDWTEIYQNEINLDKLISYCMAQINKTAPHGKLRLAGYSFGGMMAYAVAAAFVASGRDVARLGILDSPALPTVVSTRYSMNRRWRRFSSAVRKRELDREIARLIAGLITRSRSPFLLRNAARLRYARLPLNMDEHLARPFQMRFRLQLLRDLVDRMKIEDTRLDIATVLFRCAEREQVDEAHDLGWGRHIQHLQVVSVPGNHSTIIAPANLAHLCQAFVASMLDD